jgi:hypothetical protein
LKPGGTRSQRDERMVGFGYNSMNHSLHQPATELGHMHACLKMRGEQKGNDRGGGREKISGLEKRVAMVTLKVVTPSRVGQREAPNCQSVTIRATLKNNPGSSSCCSAANQTPRHHLYDGLHRQETEPSGPKSRKGQATSTARLPFWEGEERGTPARGELWGGDRRRRRWRSGRSSCAWPSLPSRRSGTTVRDLVLAPSA